MIEIRRVRPGDGERLRRVRLAALCDAPSAFARSYAEEVAEPPERWEAQARERSAGPDHTTFLAVDGDEVVGLVGGHRTGDEVELVSMWTDPAMRGHGVGALLVAAVVAWADGDPVNLWVTVGNDPAHRLYERCGFRTTGEYAPLPSDPCRDEVRMRLTGDAGTTEG